MRGVSSSEKGEFCSNATERLCGPPDQRENTYIYKDSQCLHRIRKISATVSELHGCDNVIGHRDGVLNDGFKIDHFCHTMHCLAIGTSLYPGRHAEETPDAGILSCSFGRRHILTATPIPSLEPIQTRSARATGLDLETSRPSATTSTLELAALALDVWLL